VTPLAALAAQPRVRLAPLPTPLQPAPRLGEALGAEVWVKRDDVGSLGLAGNKVRKLEFALGAALAAGADCVITTGAAQSNHMRATAAACAQLGLRAVLVVRGESDGGAPTGNLLLDRLLGAELCWAGTDDWGELNALTERIAGQLRDAGATPYAIPAGCSSPTGALGFVAAYRELRDQLAEAGVAARRIVHASTSGGTHAGLLLGRALAGGEGPAPLGFDVGRLYPDPVAHVARIATGAARLLGAELTFGAADVELDDSQLGDGYGAFTPAARDAIRLAARREGILFDPVYSGKGLAGLVARARELGGPLVLWHTGGAQALFADGFATPLLDG
jgi:D-cysteine desulfhydrase family pyridoxal phosphate-dependent enzyme